MEHVHPWTLQRRMKKKFVSPLEPRCTRGGHAIALLRACGDRPRALLCCIPGCCFFRISCCFISHSVEKHAPLANSMDDLESRIFDALPSLSIVSGYTAGTSPVSPRAFPSWWISRLAAVGRGRHPSMSSMRILRRGGRKLSARTWASFPQAGVNIIITSCSPDFLDVARILSRPRQLRWVATW